MDNNFRGLYKGKITIFYKIQPLVVTGCISVVIFVPGFLRSYTDELSA